MLVSESMALKIWPLDSVAVRQIDTRFSTWSPWCCLVVNGVHVVKNEQVVRRPRESGNIHTGTPLDAGRICGLRDPSRRSLLS